MIAPALISFRDLVPQISSTTYLTHGLYYYPAKFIPQVVRYALEAYSKQGDWVLDPFGGSATVGLEAVLTGRKAILTDLNLLLNHIVPLKILSAQETLSYATLTERLNSFNTQSLFRPNWSNIDYWYDEAILETLGHYWGWAKSQPDDVYKRIFEAALLPLSKYYSRTEHKAPKLFSSPAKRALMAEILASDWKTTLAEKFKTAVYTIFQDLQRLQTTLKGQSPEVLFQGGVDASRFDYTFFNRETSLIITSPPYLQAQEYIRTFKLDLFWLGYSETDVKALSQLEIPYRKATRIVETPTLNQVRASLERPDLVKLLDAYFDHTLQALEQATQTMQKYGRLALFVGNPKADGIEVETWRIALEYFSEKGFTFEHIYEDRIKTRQLFGGRKNKNPDGMKSEYLLTLIKN